MNAFEKDRHTGRMSEPESSATKQGEWPGRSTVLAAIHAVLQSDNSLSRLHGLRALARIGADDPASLDLAIAHLHDPDPDLRTEAAIALGRLGARRAVEQLLESMEGDPEGEVRIEAARALGRIADPAATERLLRCVEADGYPECDVIVDDLEYGAAWDVQAEALVALGAIAEPRTAPKIIALLNESGNEHLQERGLEALARLDSDAATGFLLDRLAKGDAMARRRAVEALSSTLAEDAKGEPPQAVTSALTDALLDEDPGVRMAAAGAIAQMDSPLAAASLALLLEDNDAGVRGAVARHLARMKGGAVAARLHAMLDDASPETRRAITRTLADLADPSSFEPLARLLDTEDEALLFDVIEALGRIPPPRTAAGRDMTGAAASRLAAMLADREKSDALRMRAAMALGRLLALGTGSRRPTQGADDTAALAPAARGKRREGGESIAGETPPPDAPTPLDILRTTATAADPRVSPAALEALALADPEGAEDILVAILADAGGDAASTGDSGAEDPAVPEGAEGSASAILSDPHADIVEVPPGEQAAVVKALLGKDPQSSTLAAMLTRAPDEASLATDSPPGKDENQGEGEALGEGEAELGPLEGPFADMPEAGTDETDETHARAVLRMHAARLLGTLPGAGREAVQALERTLADPFAGARQEAIRALAEIGDQAALDAILEHLADPDPEVRLEALRAAGRLSPPKSLDRRLVEFLSHPDPVMREHAVRALASAAEPMAPDHLAEALDDDDIGVCRAALAALRRPPLDALLRSRLLQLLFRFSGDLRLDVAATLARLGDGDGLSVLLQTLRDPAEDDYHWICIDALAEAVAQLPQPNGHGEVGTGRRALAG